MLKNYLFQICLLEGRKIIRYTCSDSNLQYTMQKCVNLQYVQLQLASSTLAGTAAGHDHR